MDHLQEVMRYSPLHQSDPILLGRRAGVKLTSGAKIVKKESTLSIFRTFPWRRLERYMHISLLKVFWKRSIDSSFNTTMWRDYVLVQHKQTFNKGCDTAGRFPMTYPNQSLPRIVFFGMRNLPAFALTAPRYKA